MNQSIIPGSITLPSHVTPLSPIRAQSLRTESPLVLITPLLKASKGY